MTRLTSQEYPQAAAFPRTPLPGTDTDDCDSRGSKHRSGSAFTVLPGDLPSGLADGLAGFGTDEGAGLHGAVVGTRLPMITPLDIVVIEAAAAAAPMRQT